MKNLILILLFSTSLLAQVVRIPGGSGGTAPSGTVVSSGGFSGGELLKANDSTGTNAVAAVDGTDYVSPSTLDAAIPSSVTRDTEWDTVAKIETATSDDILVKTEIDTQGEFEAKLFAFPPGGQTGTMIEQGTWLTGQVPMAQDGTGTNMVAGPITGSGTNITVTGTGSFHSLDITNEVAASSFRSTGDAADSYISVTDDDGSNTVRIEAAAVTTTDINMVFPAAPFTGIPYFTVSGATNFIMSQVTTGAGVTNISDVVSANLAAGSNITLATNANGEVEIAASGGGKMAIRGGSSSTTVSSSTTYYSGHAASVSLTTTQGRYGVPIDFSGTIVSYWVAIHGSGGTGENVTVDLWLNNTTSVGSHTEVWNSWPLRTITSSLSQAVVSGDYIEVRIATPSWVTPPTGIILSWGVTCSL